MQDISLEKLSLIGYDKINQSDEKEKTVHFFLDDYRFESIYKNPDDKIERLKKFNAVMSPDFSIENRLCRTSPYHIFLVNFSVAI